jgi:enoyl-CoA hydratase/methylglutaconyl-CoA hydratase
MDEVVRLEVTGAVARITLNSPANRNALSRALVTRLAEHLAAADADESVRAVVIGAAGPVFCSGADMKEAATGGMEEGARALVAIQRQIAALSKPVLARVHGPVRAGGLGIVGASDVVVCGDTVTFAFTEVLLGLAPAVISLTTLPRMTTRGATRAFLTGETFPAAEAQRVGLVTAAVPPERLDAEVDAVVQAWAAASSQGLRETKRLLNHDLVRRIDDLGEQMARQSAELFASPEAVAAMQAFLARSR